MSNMCRDEITGILKTKLDIVFGSSFNTNGLGGVLTCGVTGVKAGLSHSPVSAVSFRGPHALPHDTNKACRHLSLSTEGSAASKAWLKRRGLHLSQALLCSADRATDVVRG